MAGFRTAEDAKQFAVVGFCHFIIIAAFLTICVYISSVFLKYSLRYVPFVLSGETVVSLTMNCKSFNLRRRTAALGPRRNYPANAEMWAFMTSLLITLPGECLQYYLNFLTKTHSSLCCFGMKSFCGLQCMVSGIEWGGERACGRGNYACSLQCTWMFSWFVHKVT